MKIVYNYILLLVSRKTKCYSFDFDIFVMLTDIVFIGEKEEISNTRITVWKQVMHKKYI